MRPRFAGSAAALGRVLAARNRARITPGGLAREIADVFLADAYPEPKPASPSPTQRNHAL